MEDSRRFEKEGSMAGRPRSSLAISAEQARLALAVLINEGKLAARDVYGALARRERLIRQIRERLHALGAEGVELAGDIRKVATTRFKRAEEASREPRRKAVSAAVKATRQAQGHYLAAIRQLSKSARKRIKTIREKSGVRAAIAAAKRMASW
jgi:hypothetical protein